MNVLTWKLPGKLLRKENKAYYIYALILLWIFVIASFAVDWIVGRGGFVANNISPLAIYIGVDGSVLTQKLGNAILLIYILISDTILVRSAPYMLFIILYNCRYGVAIFYGIMAISWLSWSHYLLQN